MATAHGALWPEGPPPEVLVPQGWFARRWRSEFRARRIAVSRRFVRRGGPCPTPIRPTERPERLAEKDGACGGNPRPGSLRRSDSHGAEQGTEDAQNPGNLGRFGTLTRIRFAHKSRNPAGNLVDPSVMHWQSLPDATSPIFAIRPHLAGDPRRAWYCHTAGSPCAPLLFELMLPSTVTAEVEHCCGLNGLKEVPVHQHVRAGCVKFSQAGSTRNFRHASPMQ